jgi:hypothetical protein
VAYEPVMLAARRPDRLRDSRIDRVEITLAQIGEPTTTEIRTTMHQQADPSPYHERALARARQHLDRSLAAMDDVERTLTDAGVPVDQLAAIANAQMELFELDGWLRDEIGAAPPVPLAVAVPAARAIQPVVDTPPPVGVAISLLFGAGGEADLETEFGQLVTARLIERTAARITAVVARMAITVGMTVRGRLTDGYGQPWRLVMTCREASERDGDARVSLDVMEVHDDEQREVPRLGLVGDIALGATACATLPAGTELVGEVLNVSRLGLAFSIDAPSPLRPGDRLRFHVRLVEGVIAGELRLASVRAGAQSVVCGGWFTIMEPGTSEAINAVFDRMHRPAPVSYPQVRALFAGAETAPAPRRGLGWAQP